MPDAAMPHAVGEEYRAHNLFYGIFIPDWVERLPISSSAKRLLGRLHRYQGGVGECYPSLNRLACDLALSKRQVQNLMNELETEGLIFRCRPTAEDLGQGESTRYKFLWHEEIKPEDLRIDTPREANWPRGREGDFSEGREDHFQGLGNHASHKEKYLKEPKEETTPRPSRWRGVIDNARKSQNVVGVSFKLSEEQEEYITLRVEDAVAEGKITSSEGGYRTSLVDKAKNAELDMCDIESLRERRIRREEKAERQAMKEKQEEESKNERSTIEKFRLEHGLSIEELCRKVFSERSGVGEVSCDQAKGHLFCLYRKEAEDAQRVYYAECAKRAQARKNKAQEVEEKVESVF